jgi:hypothetical protein
VPAFTAVAMTPNTIKVKRLRSVSAQGCGRLTKSPDFRSKRGRAVWKLIVPFAGNCASHSCRRSCSGESACQFLSTTRSGSASQSATAWRVHFVPSNHRCRSLSYGSGYQPGSSGRDRSPDTVQWYWKRQPQSDEDAKSEPTSKLRQQCRTPGCAVDHLSGALFVRSASRDHRDAQREAVTVGRFAYANSPRPQ